MATGAMKKIVSLLPENEFELIDSENYPVSGGEIDPKNVDEELEEIAKKGEKQGLSAEDAKYLAELYGSNAEQVFAMKDQGTFEGLSLAESMSLRYAMEAEMTLTPVDYLLRRTNYMLFISHRLMEIKDAVVDAMANYFEWDAALKKSYQAELEQQIKETQLTDLKK